MKATKRNFKVIRGGANYWILKRWITGGDFGGRQELSDVIVSSKSEALRRGREWKSDRPNPGYKRNAGPLSRRKSKKFAKKALERLGFAPKKKNPVALKPLRSSTGWMKADGVKIRRNKGKIEVYIRRKRRATPKTKRRR